MEGSNETCDKREETGLSEVVCDAAAHEVVKHRERIRGIKERGK